MTVKIEALVEEIPQTFEYGNVFAREDVGGHPRLRVGLNETLAGSGTTEKTGRPAWAHEAAVTKRGILDAW